jgi:NAD(P)-dependent dehydrogenase (short-subunit alcohol dehydrogenase family)
MKVLVTGSSSGLGYALVSHYLEKDAEVFGLSRSRPDNADAYHFVSCDVGALETVEAVLQKLLSGVTSLDIVYLNAGTLGRIQDMSACSMEELKEQMDVNLWSNKVILDYLIKQKVAVGQIIAISSGASQSGSLGWNGYSLSKSTLNMLVKLYAKEMPGTHLCALAPGLIETPMLDSILSGDHDTRRYTTVERLRASKEDGLVYTPDEVAAMIEKNRSLLRNYESGAYIDIRSL